MSYEKKQFIKDLKEKEPVSTAFLIKFSAVSTDKNGKPFMNLVLMDNTGEVEARIWDDVSRHVGQAVRDAFVWIDGRCQLYQGRKQIVISKIQVLREDEVEVKHFIAESPVDPGPLYARLLEFVSSIKDPHYRQLCEAVFRDDHDVADRMKRAPAAKSFHHAYRGGLLEHVVSMLGMLDAAAANYKGRVNRDLLIAGGLLHDIGKLWELSYERVTDYTSDGRLLGHLVMGTEYVARKMAEAGADFPEEKKSLIKHMILSHHGELEFGSPKRPKCVEAMILHYIDDLDSKVNSIAVFVEQDQTPGAWSAFSKNYDRFFYKGTRTP